MKIEFDVKNAAFDEYGDAEIRRILEKIADEVILFIMLTVCILIKILKELAVIVFKVQESRHRYHKVPPGVPDFILHSFSLPESGLQNTGLKP